MGARLLYKNIIKGWGHKCCTCTAVLFKGQWLTATITWCAVSNSAPLCRQQVNYPHSSLLGDISQLLENILKHYDANLGAKLKYAEQYCTQSNSIAASCSLGSKHCMYVCMHTYIQASLASQRVKGYHKNTHGMAVEHTLIYPEKKSLSLASLVESSPVSWARKEVAATSFDNFCNHACLKRLHWGLICAYRV